MCDYSLHAVKTRDAEVGDKLMVTNFGTGTRGFARPQDCSKMTCGMATCLKPGTEITFEAPVEYWSSLIGALERHRTSGTTARFRKIDEAAPRRHHDALEFSDGTIVLLTLIVEGQRATVLQLPAHPMAGARATGPSPFRESARAIVSTAQPC